MRRPTLLLTAIAAAACSTWAAAADPIPDRARIYIGTYTNGESKGIYLSEIDLRTGAFSQAVLVAEMTNPSFLAIHPSKRFLYAVGEVSAFRDKKAGGVAAFEIDSITGKLKLLNTQPSGGTGPCYVTCDRTGRNALVANYGGGSVACLPIGENGSLAAAKSVIQHEGSSVNPARQKEPHAHSINLSPTNKFAYAADLGTDKIMIYKFDAEAGTLTPNDPPYATVPPGAGPRHLDFHPNGKFAYCINELDSTVTAFSYDDETGALKALQSIPTLKSFRGPNYTADIHVHPSGKFVYGSNRGHDSITIFHVNEDGALSWAGYQYTGGKVPRNFAIDPTGRFILAANQTTSTINLLTLNQDSGSMGATETILPVYNPVCVKLVTP